VLRIREFREFNEFREVRLRLFVGFGEVKKREHQDNP
jgi:hypothetical protein